MRAHTSALCDKSHLVFCVGFPRSRWRAFSQPCRCASTSARPQDTLPTTSPPHPSPRTPRRAAVGLWCPDAPTPPATAGAHPATSPATPTGATPEGSHTQPSPTRCQAPHATCSAWRPRAIPHYGRAHSTAWSVSHALSAVDPASSPVTPPSAVPVHTPTTPTNSNSTPPSSRHTTASPLLVIKIPARPPGAGPVSLGRPLLARTEPPRHHGRRERPWHREYDGPLGAMRAWLSAGQPVRHVVHSRHLPPPG
jgi:hypothetical protein